MERKPSLDLKRNFGFDDDGHTPDKRMRANSDSSVRPQAPDQSDESSSEAQNQEIELIAAEDQIIKLESSVENQKNIRKDIQIQFKVEEPPFQGKHLKNEQKLLACMTRDLDTSLEEIQVALENYKEAERIHKTEEACWKKEKIALEQQVAELKDMLLKAEVARKAQPSEHSRRLDELQQYVERLRAIKDKLKEDIQTRETYTSLLAQSELNHQLHRFRRKLELQQRDKELRESMADYARTCSWLTSAKLIRREEGIKSAVQFALQHP